MFDRRIVSLFGLEGLKGRRHDEKHGESRARGRRYEPRDPISRKERNRHRDDVAQIAEDELQELSHARAAAAVEPGARECQAMILPATA